MSLFLLRRFVNYVALLIVATFLAFALASLTFHPLEGLESRNPRPPQTVIDAKAHELHLDEPIPVRYVQWLGGVVHGDFGKSITGTPVGDELGRRIGVSLRLLAVGTLVGAVGGVILGVVSAIRQYRFTDRVGTVFSLIVLSAPTFLIAALLQLIAVKINGATGHQVFLYIGETSSNAPPGFFAALVDRAQHILLPTISLGVAGIAMYSRYQRNAMLDVLGADFLRLAQSKGLTRRQALFKHGLRTALIPMATLFAYGFGAIVVGATFTEKIFGWNGMGSWAVDGISAQDTNITAAVTLFTAVVILASGLLADVLYAALDPRVRI